MVNNLDHSRLWDNFDKIYCISVDDRLDRQQEVQKQFKYAGLENKVEFLIVKRHPIDTEHGIYESHLACIQKGLEAGAQTIVIFEDDVIFDRFDFARLKCCIDFLSNDPDWNIFFLGCLVKNSRKTIYPCILKITYRSLTHGYVINRQFAQFILTQKWDQISYDGMLRNVQHNYFAAYPSFAFQSNSKTDNAKYLNLDKFRRAFGGLQRIQKMNEFYYQNQGFVITVHLLFILFCLLKLKC